MDIEESNYFTKVLQTCHSYRRHALNHNHRRRHDFMALPEHHKRLIPQVLDKINLVDEKIIANSQFLALLINEHSQPIVIDSAAPPVSAEMDKVRSTLKQFVRDWAVQGKPEREATYRPILDTLEALYSNTSVTARANVRVLVPGAGLGRLAYDIATKGFSCQGKVDILIDKLLASEFILNRSTAAEQYEIYPFIHSFSNIKSTQAQLTPVRVPDIVPGNLPPDADFSMVAGDFLEVYRGDNVTCFFIDTAKNILEYIETIHRILKTGGTWINIGPLLYHFEDSIEESSVELSLQELRQVVIDMGFSFKSKNPRDK
ncbi:N2227-like protein-domain-containing protein [Phycomyces nitens]|nr:N2227-like protein-domain-containing protein [Phycomyces nitens]